MSPLDDPMGYARESKGLETEAQAEYQRHDPLAQNAIDNIQRHLATESARRAAPTAERLAERGTPSAEFSDAVED